MTPVNENSQIENLKILEFSFEAPYFQALYDAPMPVTIAREDGRLLLINRAFQEATGYTPEMISTLDDWADFQAEPTAGVSRRFADYFKLEKALTPVQVTVKTNNGKCLVWEILNAPLGKTADGHRMIITIASDLTGNIIYQQHLEAEVCKRTEALNHTIDALRKEIEERRRISKALTRSHERLKNLSLRTLTILEADRRTISKELHDSLGASLAAIKFSLEDKEIKRSQKGGRLDDSLEQEIAHLLSTIKETKRISANLRPTTLDDLGLMATVKWYLRQLKRVYQEITINYTADIIEDDVPEEMKIIIYRIIQEGLTNAQKHSEASVVRLHMAFTENRQSITLLIEDNGRGFNVEEALSQKDPLSGYGLTAMRERCEIFGGSFQIHSEIGKGTRVRATLPVFPPQ